MKNILISFIIFTFIIFNNTTTHAAAPIYYWHNAGVNTNWDNVANWRIGTYSGTTATVLPASTDSVLIGNSSTNFTVTLNVNATIKDLTLTGSGQLLSLIHI